MCHPLDNPNTEFERKLKASGLSDEHIEAVKQAVFNTCPDCWNTDTSGNNRCVCTKHW